MTGVYVIVVLALLVLSTIAEFGSFLARESEAAGELTPTLDPTAASSSGELLPS